VGPGITITVREVDSIKAEKNKPAPLVISKLTIEEQESIIEKSK